MQMKKKNLKIHFKSFEKSLIVLMLTVEYSIVGLVANAYSTKL